jgi:hypothetical protein
MERLSLTHEQWYNLPQWERDTWIAREIYKEETTARLIDSLKDKAKNQYNAYGINAILLMRYGLI